MIGVSETRRAAVSRNTCLRSALIFAGVLAVPALFTFCRWYCLVEHPRRNTAVGPVRTFQLNADAPSLSDALAVEKAKEALTLDGYDFANWQLREDRRSTAPDGTRDVYLLRNGDTPNRGEIGFVPRNGDILPRVTVAVELAAGQVKCQVSCAKFIP